MAKAKPMYFCRVLLKDFTSRAWPAVDKLEHFKAFIIDKYPGCHAICVFDGETMVLLQQFNPVEGFSVKLKYFLYKDEWFSNHFDEPLSATEWEFIKL
jgi:hypothetical protein